jgi:large subunit GTPase 1
MAGDKKSSNLGRALIKSRWKGGRKKSEPVRFQFQTDQENVTSMESITQENDLDAFMRIAELKGQEFTAEKLNIKIIDVRTQTNTLLLSEEEKALMLRKIKEYGNKLVIPKRPTWKTEDGENISKEELDRIEKQMFLEWRRMLSVLEEKEGMILTPYERNLEVWRQLWRVVERSDVVIQIVDARNPLFFLSMDLINYSKSLGKDVMILVNKSDFLTKKQRISWKKYLHSKRLEAIFFSALFEEEEKHMSDSNVLSVNELYNFIVERYILEKNRNISSDVKKERVVVGFVGYPNVGKSSTINALVGQKCVNVSSTPGKTKHYQTIILTPQVTICDCPGLVFPSFATTKADMVINGVLPIDHLREYISPITLVCERVPKITLEHVYGLNLPENPKASDLLQAYAISRGFQRSGQGNPDEARAARYILKDFVNGKILYCNSPPPH